ncbi:DUF4369 domain-containing protein [Pedobacter punctiformis]|uniref:DUF4369 domain-containing protein n=1 Tax=Pedobacter punctiformis TaxID=3004097 RepID=A0ABT4LB89_9SPHI|nr:DUF4369 domain-containing protein [Pedobacter sp. HCMS5-2]MCZ4245196.1 DUF4369 domain-containing protein [Pedobacter sp. HCMS5-2]
MKRFLILTISLLPFLCFAQEVKTQLNAKINFPEYDKSSRLIYFIYQQKDKSIIDSTWIRDNTFTFNKSLSPNVKVKLLFTKPGTSPNQAADPNILNFFVKEGTVNVDATGYLGRAKVTGVPVQDEYTAFKKVYLKIDTSLRLLGWKKKRTKVTDTLKMKIVDGQIDSARNAKMSLLCTFLDQNLNKPYAPDALLMYLKANGSTLNLDKADQYFSKLPVEQQKSVDGSDIIKEIADLRKKNKKN